MSTAPPFENTSFFGSAVTSVHNEILSNWPALRLGDIALKVGSGATPRGADAVYKPTGVPLIRSMNVHFSGFRSDGLVYLDRAEAKLLDNVTVKRGDVLLNITGASIGRVTVAPNTMDGARVNQHVCIIRPNANLLPLFLAYFLASPSEQERVRKTQVGATRQALTKAMVLSWNVPVPPLEEQHRIVAEIERQFTRLDAGVASLKRVQAAVKRYRASVLNAACEGRLVPTEAEFARKKGRSYENASEILGRILSERRRNWNGRGKYKEPFAADIANLPRLPEGWVWLTVDALAFVTKLAGFEYTKFVKYLPDGDLPVIKAENAGRDGFKQTEFSRVKTSAVAHLTRSQLKPGDLLMVFVGAGTGNVALVPADQRYFLGPNIGMIRIESRDVSAAYLEFFLRSPLGNTLTLGFAKAVAQPSLSMGSIRRIPVALPPLSEQGRIVTEIERRLSVIEQLRGVVAGNVKRADRLRQSILNCAFSGQL